MRKFARRFVASESGSSMVEFALALLLFFIVLFGTIELGLAVYRYNMVSDLAQEGARWASVRGSTSSLLHASNADVQTFVQSRAIGMTVTVTTPLGAPSTLQPGQTVSVLVQTAVAPLTRLIPHGTLTLSSTASMVIAR
jgi:Flp pilus assembly protein TadG